jgi:predicted ATP-grasp superfamily ATP-dependent carboligase
VPTDYPRGLIGALADAPRCPLIYLGGLENYPALLSKLAVPLWGNGADVLRRVRSPFLLTRHLQSLDVPCPAVRTTLSNDRRWLLKPRRGAGGAGIRPCTDDACNRRTHYLQEWLEGTPVSAVFVGRRDGTAELLGTTRQLIGTSWLHARSFQYAGNIGALPLSPSTQRAWQRLGDALAGDFGVRGLFGVDAILRGDVPWPVEVNPRYTASVEVLERGLDMPFLSLHRAVFEDRPLAALAPAARVTWGKAILYAAHDLVFPADGPWRRVLEGPIDPLTPFADIPAPGEPIAGGQPVLTLFASGSDVADCETRLRQTARDLDQHLWG